MFNLLLGKKQLKLSFANLIFALSSKKRRSVQWYGFEYKHALRQWRSTRSAALRMPTFPLAVPPATPMIKGSRFEDPFPAGSPGIVSLSASMLHLRGNTALWHTRGLYTSHLTPHLCWCCWCSLEEGKTKKENMAKKNKTSRRWNV